MPESHSTGRSAPAGSASLPRTPQGSTVLDDLLRHAHARAVLRELNRSEGERAEARTVLGLRDPRATAPETMRDCD